MKTILHLSDIHFGRTNPVVINAIIRKCKALKPDLVVISGDFTQRARIKEFEEAHTFIKKISGNGVKIIAIPGNHDIRPIFSPLKRLRDPFDRYNEYIAPLVLSSFVDSTLVMRGINTVRASRLKGGHVAMRDLKDASEWFGTHPPHPVRILITHHPLDLPETYGKRKLARRAKRGIYELSQSHIDVYLSGHFHRSSAIVTKKRYDKEHYAAIAVQAGTISTRSRGELQSFNLLEIDRKKINVTPHLWQPEKKKFLPSATSRFTFKDQQWISA